MAPWDKETWEVTKLASLGGSGVVKRKFLYAPDVVFQQGYDAVVIGSGDREHPFDGISPTPGTVDNRVYVIKDVATGRGPVAAATITEATLLNVLDPGTMTFPNSSGCMRPLANSAAAGGYGEKATGVPDIRRGYASFNTHYWPSATSDTCVPEYGIARNCVMDLTCGVAADGITQYNTS